MKIGVLTLFLYVVSSHGVTIPSNWTKCKSDKTMNECLKKAIQFSVRSLDKGNKTLGVIPLDPWKVKLFEYNNNSGLVALKLQVRDVTMIGFGKSKIDYVKNDWKYMEMLVKTDKLTMFGKYAVNGSVVFLPIGGKGNFHVDAEDFSTKVRIFLEKYDKKGKEHLKATKILCTPNAVRINSRFDNLINGNKELSDRMNQIINNNWDVIVPAFQPYIMESTGVPFKAVANSFFSRVPTEEFII